ncbi:MAG: NTPase [Leptolyngbya sp.]|nr:MAG: NTPase [Leptolyngbya sp.]
MIDWLVVWGVAQAAGFVFKPILEDLVKESAKDYGKDFFKDCLKKVIHLPEKDVQKEAYGKALKEFLQFVQQELEDADYQDAQIKQYIQPLRNFIQQDAIAAALGRAFEENCKGLDIQLLAQTWQDLNLPKLPPEFNWERVSRRYLKRVKAIVHESDKLRPIFAAQAQTSMAEGVQELVGIAPEFDLGRYAEGLKEQYGNLKLESLDTTGGYYELKLWKVFVPQNVRECQEFLPQVYEIPKDHGRRLRQSGHLDAAELVEVELERSRRVYIEQPIRSVLEVVGDPASPVRAVRQTSMQQVVILGDPGSGKSTLLQYIALVWAERSLSELPLHPIPLLLELRTYARDKQAGKCQDMLSFIHSGNVTCRLNQQQLHDTLKAGDAIALFDGIDEVFDPGLRDEVVTDIHRFTNDYPTVQVIATSRWLGYKAQRLRDAGFHHLMLQDLDDEQIAAFIQRWHDLTFADAADKVRKQERLQKAVQDSKAIRELAGNPLLLTMMAILNRNQELPRDRPELYNQASRVLLHQWDVERALVEDQRLDPKTIDYRDKQAMLRQVAYHMQSSQKGLAGNLISATDLETILAEYLKQIEIDQPRTIARLMIQQLRTRNFILCYLGADSYAFVHRTFLEYFCAWEFVWQFKETQTLTAEQLKLEVFGQHWQDETWHEVLRLIAGLIDAKFVGEIIDYLLAQTVDRSAFLDEMGRQKKEGLSNLLLAAHCFAEVRNKAAIATTSIHLLTTLQREVEQESPYPLDPESATALITLIATLWQEHPETLPWLKGCQFGSSAFILMSAVRAIAQGWKDDPETLPWLKSLAQTDENEYVRRAAVQELAQGWKDDPETLAMLKSLAQTEDDWYVRSAAVQAIAQGWKDNPETLPILKSLAQTDANEYVRSAAVQAIAQGWKDDPETLAMLKSLAQTDDDWYVRSAAVQAIAQGWKYDPDTLPMLKSLAQTDDDGNGRRAAVEALAQGWKDDPETLPWLKSLAQTDENEYVRGVAVQAIAQGWKYDPDTLPWLKSLAQNNDDDWSVRSAAVEALAQGWKDDPTMFEFLSDRALHDPYARGTEEFSKYEDNPRQTALEALVNHYPEHPQTWELLSDRAQSDPDEEVRQFATQKLAALQQQNEQSL